MRLQPPFFVRQTEIILQTALLFSYFFLSFFGQGFQVAQRFVSCLSRFHITRVTGDEYDSVVLCQHGCSELRQPNFYRLNQGVCPETEQVSPKIVALKIMKTGEFLLMRFASLFLSRFRRNGSNSFGTQTSFTKSPSVSSSFLHFATGTVSHF